MSILCRHDPHHVRVFGTHGNVVLQNLAHKLVLSMGDGLDDEPIVLRKVKETSTLSRGTQLRKNVFAGQGNLDNG